MRIAELTQPQKVNVAPLSRKLVGTQSHEEVADIVADQFPDVQVIIRNSPIYDMGPDMAITSGFYDPPTGDKEENIGLDLLFDSPDEEITWNNKNRKQFIRSIQDTLHHELLHKNQERSRQDRGYDRESERGSAYARDKSQPYYSVDDEIEAFALNSAEQLIRDARNDKQRALEILRNARNAEELKNKLAGKKGSDLKRYLDRFKPGDPTLKRFLKKVVQFIQATESIEEGVGSTLAKLGLVGAVAAGGAGAYNAAQDYKDTKDSDTAKVAQAPAQDKKDLSKIELPTKQDTQTKTEYKPLTSNKNEIILAKHARDAGIKGIELASFMSQMAHESENFSDMIEDISHERAAKKYGSGKIAKILGNKNENDAVRFKGRGYIQLTGRWNYEWMEKELGIDLTSSWSAAQRAADPDIAADIAVAYWKKRVQSKVSDFTDVRAVTKKINPGLHGLDSRQDRFEKVAGAMGLRGDGEA